MYYRLKIAKSDPDNLTLCPILDFANHSLHGSNMRPSSTNTYPPSMTESLCFFSQDVAIQAGDEIFLTYGRHSNKTLFVEYGFVDVIHDHENVQGEVDVQDVLEEIAHEKQWRRSLVKEVLVDQGYWG